MEEKIREELYSKLESEFDSYKKELETLTSKEIIDKSYETTMKEELMCLFYPESQRYDLDEIKALKNEKNSLETLYQGWMDSDLNINQLLEDNTDEIVAELAEYIKFPNLTKEEELECIKDWIKNADDSKYEKWVITLKSDNTPIGNISVNRIEKRHNYCNVGYVILYAYWGKGYASEALKVVSDYLLESGYYLVECSCNELNKQSYRVMEKAGFKKDGYIANRRLNKDGTYSGVEYYSKTK